VPPGAKIFQNGDQIGVTPFNREDIPSGKTTFILIADGYLPRAMEVTIKPGEKLKSNTPLEKPNETYQGTIKDVPVTIEFAADRTSGTIKADPQVLAKFSGAWSGSLFRATIDEIVTAGQNVLGAAKSFVMRVSEDGKVAAYKLDDGQKTLSGSLASLRQLPKAELPARSSGWRAPDKLAPVYRGTIRVKYDGSVPPRQLTITVGPDIKSGTMTQSSRKGDFVVKFTGVWEEAVLHAVTSEVISQPAGPRWEPEAFSLRLNEDGKGATYEVNADGKTYIAELTAD
jgi:hypothetical protein